MGMFGLTKYERAVWNRIQPQEKIKLFLHNDPQQAYMTEVVEVTDSFIRVKTPLQHNAGLTLSPGMQVGAELFSADFGKLEFVSKVSVQEGPGQSVTKISCPRSIKQTQVRKFYRLQLMLDVECILFEVKNGRLEPRGNPFHAFTKDVSEGGLMLVSEKWVEKGNYLDLRITLASNQRMSAVGKVVRTIAGTDGAKCLLGLEFAKISNEDRELLRLFIFQRARRKYQDRR
jgi:c-di-GMP-binding flagellar brake protein YcgR